MSRLNAESGKLSKPLFLINSSPGPGISMSQDTPKRKVWANVYLAGIRTQTSMLAVNKSVEYLAEVWERSYKGESHAEYNGIKYKIESVLPAESPLMVKLALRRK